MNASRPFARTTSRPLIAFCSAATAARSGAFFRTTTTRRAGSVFASSRNGFAAITRAHSAALRTKKSRLRPSRFAAPSSSNRSILSVAVRLLRKTRFPLCSSVRASSMPSTASRSRRSLIATTLRPARLIARTSPIYVANGLLAGLRRRLRRVVFRRLRRARPCHRQRRAVPERCHRALHLVVPLHEILEDRLVPLQPGIRDELQPVAARGFVGRFSDPVPDGDVRVAGHEVLALRVGARTLDRLVDQHAVGEI